MVYPGSHGHYLITQIENQTAKVVLTDHSEWKVVDTDHYKLKAWWTFEEVMVTPTKDNRFQLFHTRRREAVEVERIR